MSSQRAAAQRNKKMGINWDEMVSGKFIKLETGTMKEMVLTKWEAQTKFKDGDNVKPGVTFQVIEEDGKKYEGDNVKEWTTTSMRALALLKIMVMGLI